MGKRKKGSRKKKIFKPGKRTQQKQKLPVYNMPQQVDGFDAKRVSEAMAAGAGKRGKIYYRIDKSKINVQVGDIIQESDGLYRVDEIRRGASCQKTAVVYCSAFDPKNIKDNQILKPKKV